MCLVISLQLLHAFNIVYTNNAPTCMPSLHASLDTVINPVGCPTANACRGHQTLQNLLHAPSLLRAVDTVKSGFPCTLTGAAGWAAAAPCSPPDNTLG